QENRSFDHYYGFAPLVQSFGGGWAVPAGYAQPAGHSGAIAPFPFTTPTPPAIPHAWKDMHREYDHGKMDGFYSRDGANAMGYFDDHYLDFYYSLFNDSAVLCMNYFSSVMGPTYPNRFYLAAGTSGGITTNGVYGYSVFDYPIILDLLEQ